MRGQATHLATLLATDEDADDYRQAVEWLADRDPAAALEMAVDLESLWTTRVSPEATRRVLQPLIEQTPDAPPALRSTALLMMADNDRNNGLIADARRAAQEATELESGDLSGNRYAAAVVLGQVLALQGQLDQAEVLFEQSLRAARERNDVQLIVGALREIANLAIERRRPAEALAPLDEATELALADEGAHWMLGILSADRARVALERGDVDAARAEFESSLARAQELGIGRAIAGCSLGLAHVERLAGNPDVSRPLMLEAHRFYRDQGDVGGLAHLYVEAAMQHSVAGEHDRAVQLLAGAEATRARMEIVTPGSEGPAIHDAWEAARRALGEDVVSRLAREGRAASADELAALV
jgi:ATP/maltotriose-dependent transcriptional regulator MalT